MQPLGEHTRARTHGKHTQPALAFGFAVGFAFGFALGFALAFALAFRFGAALALTTAFAYTTSSNQARRQSGRRQPRTARPIQP